MQPASIRESLDGDHAPVFALSVRRSRSATSSRGDDQRAHLVTPRKCPRRLLAFHHSAFGYIAGCPPEPCINVGLRCLGAGPCWLQQGLSAVRGHRAGWQVQDLPAPGAVHSFACCGRQVAVLRGASCSSACLQLCASCGWSRKPRLKHQPAFQRASSATSCLILDNAARCK